MRLIGMKLLLLVLYAASIAGVGLNAGMFGGVGLLVAAFFLGYCGIIVLSQLTATLVAIYHWCVAENRERQGELFTAASVEFETESEAT